MSSVPGHKMVREPSRLWVVLFGVLLQSASVSQLPFLAESPSAKAALALCEALAFLLLIWKVRDVAGVRRAVAIGVALIVARFLYAWLIAYMRYDSTFIGALQEGRFGFLIVGAPAAYALFRSVSMRKLGEIALVLLATLITADLLATWFLARPGYISIGGRGASRYVMSVVPILMFAWMRMTISFVNHVPPRKLDLFLIGVSMLHIVLFSTSRSEAIICVAILAQWLYITSPNLRWPLLGAVVVAVYLLFVQTQPTGDAQIAGRDYRLAVTYSQDAFPFGVGLVPELVQKQQLGTAGNFFASDYGPILLIYRYGAIGLVMGLALLLYWLRFLRKSLDVPGGFFIAAATLLYFLIVPLLDYGGMVGSLLLAGMAAFISTSKLPGSAKSESELSPRQGLSYAR